MIWLRASLLAAIVGLLVLALTQASSSSAVVQPGVAAPAEPTLAPTPRPTRVPLPTIPPQMIISRVARQTPPPPATATPLAQPRVSIVDNGYMPTQQSLRVGDQVTWINTGSEGHDVTGTGPAGVWRSGPLGPSERFTRQFLLAGTYDFACSIHPEMRGRLLVQP